MHHCRLCGKSGVNSKTCPLNKNSKNPNPRRHNKKPLAYNYEDFNNYMLNIYDEPLQPCGTSSMSSGSWDSEFKCSEKGGGVHQICIDNIANNAPQFSESTGQSNWSDKRGNDNHCVCLGAWSLYNTKPTKTGKKLKCDAIPKISLSNRYVSKFSEGWNKWNGYEVSDQIVHGVESLVSECDKGDNQSKKLIKNYCNFAKHNSSLNKTPMYKRKCKN